MSFRSQLTRALLAFVLSVVGRNAAVAQLEYERDPINYSKTNPDDPIARLEKKLESGSTELQYEPDHGWLKSLLRELEIKPSSQTLVFSKTSLQRHRITPRRPRALYFNDDVYIGWVQFGHVIEISTVDPKLGGVFYTLDQKQSDTPQFLRKTDQCLICHGSSHTKRVPGHIMRSLYTDRGGQPLFGEGTYRTTDASPFKERWGGWYVTGTHGRLRHMGNETVRDRNSADKLNIEAGANVTDLSSRLRLAPYLTPHSDIVALLVLGHQVNMHNVLTSASYAGRRALHDVRVMNKALDRPADYQSDSTRRRLDSAARDVLEALLLTDEVRLRDRVTGTSSFASDFAADGPRDEKGRGLRQLDLQTRLLKYPCSYLMYSEAFRKLPPPVHDRVIKQLHGVLTMTGEPAEFAHVSQADRQAIHEILLDTLPSYRSFTKHLESSQTGSPTDANPQPD